MPLLLVDRVMCLQPHVPGCRHDTPDCGSGQGDFIYGWAPGAKEFVFPKEAGVSIGKAGLRSCVLFPLLCRRGTRLLSS